MILSHAPEINLTGKAVGSPLKQAPGQAQGEPGIEVAEDFMDIGGIKLPVRRK